LTFQLNTLGHTLQPRVQPYWKNSKEDKQCNFMNP